MRYLVIDAALNGTGIRDRYEGKYIKPESLKLSLKTIKRIKNWLFKYENEHYNNYENEELVNKLDKEGKDIARTIKEELIKVKIEYFSDALMKKEII